MKSERSRSQEDTLHDSSNMRYLNQLDLETGSTMCLPGLGQKELFHGYRISVLQDEKALEICCKRICTWLTLLHCTLKIVKRINFTLCVFYYNYQKKKKKGRGGGRGYLCYYFLLLDQIFSVHSLGSPHGQRSLAGYRSMGLQRIRHD